MRRSFELRDQCERVLATSQATGFRNAGASGQELAGRCLEIEVSAVKLLVPSWRDLNDRDACLIRLTEFLGGRVEILFLENGTAFSEAFLEERVADRHSCLVVNPEVLSRFFPQGSF